MSAHPVVGVAPGAPLRLLHVPGAPVGRVGQGRSLATDTAGQNVAVVGQVFLEDFGTGGGGMMHGVVVGQSLQLTPAVRVRVVGILARDAGGDRGVLLLPLDAAQRLFDHEGRITHLFVTLAGGARADDGTRTLEDLLLETQGR